MFIARGDLIILRILQAAVCALIPVMIYRSARLMKLGRLTGQLSALLYFFYAPALLISLDFLREGPLALVFIAILYFMALAQWTQKLKWFATAGAAAALCVLGRETLLIAALAPLLLCIRSKTTPELQWKAAACYLTALFIPILAIIAFNLAAYGNFRINIPFGNIEGINADTGNIIVLYLSNLPGRFCDFLSLYELPNSLSVYGHKEMIPFLSIFAIPFNLLAALAFIGAWQCRRSSLAVLTFVSICLFAGIMMHFEIFYRYRLPATPLIALLAGAGAMSLYRHWQQKRFRPLTLSLIFAVLFIALTWVNPDSRRTFNERAAVSRLMIENKRYAEAEKYLLKMADGGYASEVRPGVLLLVQRLFGEGEKAWAEDIASRFGLTIQQMPSDPPATP